jgi:hypothetical protein
VSVPLHQRVPEYDSVTLFRGFGPTPNCDAPVCVGPQPRFQSALWLGAAHAPIYPHGDRTRMDVYIGRMVDASEVVVPSLSGMNGKSTCS